MTTNLRTAIRNAVKISVIVSDFYLSINWDLFRKQLCLKPGRFFLLEIKPNVG